MTRVVRIDRGLLRSPKRTAQGALRVDGVFTRSGVFSYKNRDGSERREYRPPEEVFRADALESFESVPVTDDHPPELVTPANRALYQRGLVSEGVRRDGDLVVGSMVVFDAETIDKMEQGKVALSCGYEVELDETPGTHPVHGRYDAVQRNIRGNHLALVDVARAGPEARVRMDAGVQVTEFANRSAQAKVNPMKTTAELQAALDAALAEVGNQKARADRAEAELTEWKKRADTAEGAADTLPKLQEERDQARKDAARAGALENEVKALTDTNKKLQERVDKAENPEVIRRAVAKRVKIEAAAARILPPEKAARLDASDNRAVQLLIIEHTGGDSRLAQERSDDYVDAMFEAAVRGYDGHAAALSRVAMTLTERAQPREDSESAYNAMVRRLRRMEG